MTLQTVNGVRLNIEVAGEGAPLVFIHGFTGDNTTWQPFLSDPLPGYRTIAVEMLGHGRSDAPADPSRYRIENCADDLAGLLDRLELPAASVLGYSMGGRVALYFALAYPARVEALVLESASPGLPTAAEQAARRQSDHELAEFIEQHGLAAFVERWEKLPLWESQQHLPATRREALRRQRLGANPPGLANSLRGLGSGQQPSQWDRLDRLACPALLLAGELDARFTDLARQMHRHIPAARLEIIPGAGHAVHLEQPAAFRQAVQSFLTSTRNETTGHHHFGAAGDR